VCVSSVPSVCALDGSDLDLRAALAKTCMLVVDAHALTSGVEKER
jgi:hypothetical protein